MDMIQIMRFLSIATITAVCAAFAVDAKTDCIYTQSGNTYDGHCSTDYGITSLSSCDISGSNAGCWQQSWKNGKMFQKAICTSKAWGKGEGSGRNDKDCCKTDDDCKDSCNNVICGVSW